MGAQALYRSRGFQPCAGVVGERRNFIEAVTVRSGGGVSSEDAGMSNEKMGENPVRRKPKGS